MRNWVVPIPVTPRHRESHISALIRIHRIARSPYPQCSTGPLSVGLPCHIDHAGGPGFQPARRNSRPVPSCRRWEEGSHSCDWTTSFSKSGFASAQTGMMTMEKKFNFLESLWHSALSMPLGTSLPGLNPSMGPTASFMESRASLDRRSMDLNTESTILLLISRLVKSSNSPRVVIACMGRSAISGEGIVSRKSRCDGRRAGGRGVVLCNRGPRRGVGSRGSVGPGGCGTGSRRCRAPIASEGLRG